MLKWFSNDVQIEQFLWARPMPAAAMVAVFVGTMALTVYLYRRSWGVPLWRRIGMAVARLVVMALMVAALFKPTAVVRETRTHKRRLPVLLDVSGSMSVRDQRKRPEDIVEAAAGLEVEPDVEAAVVGIEVR